jgi:tetratricopeptide (TPR) repeat protein
MGPAGTPEDLLQAASRARAEGRFAEAVAAYESLLAVRPDLPDSWYNLALVRRRAGRFEAALEAYAEARARGVAGPEEVHLNRAVIFSDDLGRPDAALTELTAALQCAPAYLPALLNLGTLYEDLGDRDGAVATYRRALALDPDNALILSRLANASVIRSGDDPLVTALETALSQPGREAADQALLGFALGRALDSAGAYDAAFAACERANAAAREAAGDVVYDRRTHARLIDRLISAFPDPVPDAGEPSGPIFICGLFRSGSTLVERILGAHSHITAGGELDILPRLVRERVQPWPEAVVGADAATVADWRATVLERLRAARPGAGLTTDKRPDNFLHIGLIRTLFPGARIVHTVRDATDVCLSNWFLHLDGSMAHTMDLEDMAHWHGQYRRLMAHWNRLYPDIHTVDYDALVADPRAGVEALLGYLDLPFEPACLAFHEQAGAVRTASVWQVREPFYQRSSGRWRNYEGHLGPLRAALGAD